MEYGLLPSIKGALVPQVWFSEIFLISMLLPSITDQNKGIKPIILSVILAMIVMVYINIVTLSLLGNSLSMYAYPVFSVLS